MPGDPVLKEIGEPPLDLACSSSDTCTPHRKSMVSLAPKPPTGTLSFRLPLGEYRLLAERKLLAMVPMVDSLAELGWEAGFLGAKTFAFA